MYFQTMADAFASLETTSRRSEMIGILAGLFREASSSDIARVIYLLQGRVAPPFEPVEFGVGARLIIRAEALAANRSEEEVEELSRQAGDLGDVIRSLMPGTGAKTSVTDVFDRLTAIAKAGGAGSTEKKVQQLASLLQHLSGPEDKYIVRIVQGHLRLGVGDPTILDALSHTVAGSKELRPVLERAYNVCSDLGLVAETLFTAGKPALENFQPEPGRPVRPALAERLPSPEAIINKIGPCIAEPKYDGIRLQLHKSGDKIEIFSRRIEDLTGMFPDIAKAARGEITQEMVIAEGEALAYDAETGEYFPFQITVQRKRKNDIAEMSGRYPLRLFLFDILYADHHGLLKLPFVQRRQILEKVVRPNGTIALTEEKRAENAADLEKYFEEMIERGLEGIVAKRPDAPYQAGARNFDWVKLKRGYQAEMKDTVDCVIVGYLLGRGNRARFGFGSLLAAIYDKKNDRFRTIAKIGSGLSDNRWREMKTLLDGVRVDHKPARVDSRLVPDVWAEPKYVVEVKADEITRSPMHTAGRYGDEAGYALRFPRVVHWIREDKAPEDVTTEKEILELFRMQKRVKEQ
jgi:DNA ligase 1